MGTEMLATVRGLTAQHLFHYKLTEDGVVFCLILRAGWYWQTFCLCIFSH